MKKHVVKAALMALALSGFSGASLAWDPKNTPDLELYMSGATAMDNAIKAMFDNLCENTAAEPKDYYIDGTAGTNYRAFFCTLTPAKVPGLSASKKVLFIKRSAGGSAQGVSPLIEEKKIDALNIFNNNCVASAADPHIWNCSITNPNDLLVKNPNMGISDVDPFMFRGPNTPAGFSPVTQAGIQALEVRPVAALLFGVPVTNGLYEALQIVQIDKGTLPSNCTIGSYTEACMPSLSTHQISSLISGQIKKWSEFTVNFNGTNYPLTKYPGVINGPASDLVHFCKRTAGSGTGAQQYAKFLNSPCTRCGLPPIDISADNPLDGPRVLGNAGSGNMDQCLDDFAKGTNTSKLNSGNIVAWAIGQQSMEKNANNAFGYKFVKVDGVAPTLKNAANGTYKDWVEPTYQWRKTGAGAPTGDLLKIIDKLVVEAGSPALVASILNKSSNYTFGKSGFLAVATNGHAYNNVLDENAPVIGYSHASAGILDNCKIPVLPESTALKPF
ncbi:MAG: hypothetical protein NTV43_15975 [Methylococcales bacterium]|nr:hypothetical protein [Methylococcales bacterium]